MGDPRVWQPLNGGRCPRSWVHPRGRGALLEEQESSGGTVDPRSGAKLARAKEVYQVDPRG